MTEIRRLLDEGTEFEREILASARADVGSPDGRKRAAMAMSAAVVSAATVTAGSAAGATTMTGLGGMTAGAVVKMVGLAAVSLGVAGATARVASHVVSARAPAPHVVPVQHATTGGPAADRAPAARVLPSADRAEDSPPAPSPSARPVILAASAQAAHPRQKADAPAPPPDLRAEVDALGEARAALGRRDARAALEHLDAYNRAFPGGLLADEATILRIDALVRQHDQAAASALSRRYLDAHPGSPYATRLRSLVHEDTKE
jgi:hypothetical protein